MNYNRNSNNSGAWVILLLIGALILPVWGFSALLGLDMQSGGSFLLGLIIVGALFIVSSFFRGVGEIIHLRKIWPIILALAWACFWPALNYWSSQTFFGHFDTPWWATWYTKGGVFFAIIGLGYLINKIFEDF
ncbi:hypothetical protein [Xylella fastidiosa]|uniref:hypothetical protein n=1 Tax=Xylella fastidiosa TaxID=2371 RepID=UPI0004836529|nr:hypothetical protein [Xylella fastidiosa]AIC13901.1 hypothetical protein P303_07900 [Xylella fastidiosa MUL0034]KFA41233.1 hypothetical protein DF22_002397 [Xylella fastidiosa]MDC7969182.1 hypothetical protein [Xylella fastidiosa subsp. multiplex]MDD0909614.1 hypothetical protein [Xylella fastidiosa subsp. multiplex]MDD0929649.1 hypothetical protein [Xylella fastidiosa subsp. multiplex]